MRQFKGFLTGVFLTGFAILFVVAGLPIWLGMHFFNRRKDKNEVV